MAFLTLAKGQLREIRGSSAPARPNRLTYAAIGGTGVPASAREKHDCRMNNEKYGRAQYKSGSPEVAPSKIASQRTLSLCSTVPPGLRDAKSRRGPPEPRPRSFDARTAAVQLALKSCRRSRSDRGASRIRDRRNAIEPGTETLSGASAPESAGQLPAHP